MAEPKSEQEVIARFQEMRQGLNAAMNQLAKHDAGVWHISLTGRPVPCIKSESRSLPTFPALVLQQGHQYVQ